MTTASNEDERRIRKGLRALGVSYAPQPPAADPDAWWDELYADDDDEEEPAVRPWLRLPTRKRAEPEEEDQGDGDWEDADGDDESTPQAVRRGKRAPGRRAQEAYTGLPHRTRVLIYNGSAAGAGWLFGVESLFAGWISGCQHDTGSVVTAVIVGLGLVTAIGVLIDRRTRHWWPPLAWCCRIPLASAVLALALYTSN